LGILRKPKPLTKKPTKGKSGTKAQSKVSCIRLNKYGSTTVFFTQIPFDRKLPFYFKSQSKKRKSFYKKYFSTIFLHFKQKVLQIRLYQQ
jgi:hypothetical protein